jgi:hypothetical protein
MFSTHIYSIVVVITLGGEIAIYDYAGVVNASPLKLFTIGPNPYLSAG